jgi:hypothetical protein
VLIELAAQIGHALVIVGRKYHVEHAIYCR